MEKCEVCGKEAQVQEHEPFCYDCWFSIMEGAYKPEQDVYKFLTLLRDRTKLHRDDLVTFIEGHKKNGRLWHDGFTDKVLANYEKVCDDESDDGYPYFKKVTYHVVQWCGMCGDDYSGYILIPLKNKTYWRLGFNC